MCSVMSTKLSYQMHASDDTAAEQLTVLLCNITRFVGDNLSLQQHPMPSHAALLLDLGSPFHMKLGYMWQGVFAYPEAG